MTQSQHIKRPWVLRKTLGEDCTAYNNLLTNVLLVMLIHVQDYCPFKTWLFKPYWLLGLSRTAQPNNLTLCFLGSMAIDEKLLRYAKDRHTEWWLLGWLILFFPSLYLFSMDLHFSCHFVRFILKPNAVQYKSLATNSHFTKLTKFSDCNYLFIIDALDCGTSFTSRSSCADLLTLSIQVGDLMPGNPCLKCICTDQTDAGTHTYIPVCQQIPCDTHCPVVRLLSFSFHLSLSLTYLSTFIHSSICGFYFHIKHVWF